MRQMRDVGAKRERNCVGGGIPAPPESMTSRPERDRRIRYHVYPFRPTFTHAAIRDLN